ncbi:MAG: hypothetical protein ACLVE3_09480 [[Clostridium] scindens]
MEEPKSGDPAGTVCRNLYRTGGRIRKEEAMRLSAGARLTLGRRILRTETAGLAIFPSMFHLEG